VTRVFPVSVSVVSRCSAGKKKQIGQLLTIQQVKNTYLERVGYKSKKTDNVMSYFHLILSNHFSVGIHAVNFTDVIS
jgi:hypothetical protein